MIKSRIKCKSREDLIEPQLVTGMLLIAGFLEYTDSCQELQKLFSTTRRENSKQKKASEFLTLAFFTGGGDFYLSTRVGFLA